MKKIEKFVGKAKKIHGNKYDYSNVIYKNGKTKIHIICPHHGAFYQIPNSHLLGYGCAKCGSKSAKLKTAVDITKFIDKYKIIHDNKYDYSLVVYKNCKTKIKIICKEHGIFEQSTNHHLLGRGCPKCAGKNLTKEEVIEKCNKIHNNKYDYSVSNFGKTQDYINIICKEHGIFRQKLNAHINQKSGCPKCIHTYPSNTNNFIEKSNIIHGGRYDYSKAIYNGAKNHVIIICKEHGEFKQAPTHHLSGQSCPKCECSNGEKMINKLLIKSKIDFNHHHKFYDLPNHEFDFFIPILNLCIEYDGVQHFKPVNYFGGEKAFERQISRDKIKNNYCKVNNISLIRIPYTKSKDDVSKIITDLSS